MGTLTERIGRIAVNFSTVELLLSLFVARLISENSKVGAIVTSEMSFQNLLKAFDSLTKYSVTDTGQLNKIKILIKRLNDAEQQRNIIFHSAYGIEENTQENIRIKVTAKRGKGLKVTQEIVSHDSLENTADELKQLIKDLQDLYRGLYGNEIPDYA